MIEIQVSPGELLDRIVILQIKVERCRDQEKRQRITEELGGLNLAAQIFLGQHGIDVKPFVQKLREVNEAIWAAEDGVRQCEAARSFGPEFVSLARSMYTNNDRRYLIKKHINELFGSALTEEKVHIA